MWEWQFPDMEDLKLTPYPVSWVNRFAVWLDQSRTPIWVIALILIVVETAILQAIAWFDGSYLFPALGTEFLLIPAWTWGSLVLINYLNEVAVTALENFRVLLPLDDTGFRRLQARFTHSPARQVIILSILLIGIFLIILFVVPSKLTSGWNQSTLFAIAIGGTLMFAIGSGFYYHVINMLIMVDRSFKASSSFNLFDREPVFAFSELTARSSIIILAFATLNILLVPSSTIEVGVLVFDFLLIPIGVAIFIIPLWEAHRRLVQVKRDLHTTVERKIEAMIERLHNCLDSNDSEEMTFINKALASLGIEREFIDKLPTWPWRKGLLTGVASALLVPTTLLVIQILVQRWFQG
jgi:hypothetical protein